MKFPLSALLIGLTLCQVTEAAVTESNNAITFQVIQSEFVLDRTTVESAEVGACTEIGTSDGFDPNRCVLNITLKPEAAKLFTTLTQKAIGLKANLVLHDTIISAPVLQSALGNKFKIMNLRVGEGEKFIKSLGLKK